MIPSSTSAFKPLSIWGQTSIYFPIDDHVLFFDLIYLANRTIRTDIYDLYLLSKKPRITQKVVGCAHSSFFLKLIDRGMPLIFVRILMKWYTTQKACVRWGSALSDSFFITNGVRQGGILPPLLFNVYMDALSSSLSNTPIGCSI